MSSVYHPGMREARAWNWRVEDRQQATHGSYKHRRYGALRVTSRLIEKAKWRTQKNVCIEEQMKDRTPGMNIPSQDRKFWHPDVQTNHQQITNERRKEEGFLVTLVQQSREAQDNQGRCWIRCPLSSLVLESTPVRTGFLPTCQWTSCLCAQRVLRHFPLFVLL